MIFPSEVFATLRLIPVLDVVVEVDAEGAGEEGALEVAGAELVAG
jgi:hypothetical protein